MQIVKHTGWTLDEVYSYNIKDIHKLTIWAYNQEIAERENLFTVMQWHLGIQNKKSASKSKKNLQKALKKNFYNPEKDKTDEWTDIFKRHNPQAFDKFLNSLKPSNN